MTRPLRASTAIDLTAAIESAAKALYEWDTEGSNPDLFLSWREEDEATRKVWRGAVHVVLPHIREALAQQVNAITLRGPDNRLIHASTARSRAARVVRGDAS